MTFADDNLYGSHHEHLKNEHRRKQKDPETYPEADREERDKPCAAPPFAPPRLPRHTLN
jgi:hypothetical protein